MQPGVLQLGPYPPPHGGVQSNIVAIRQRLLEAGLECRVVTLTRHRAAAAPDVYHPRNWMEVLGLLARLDYNIAHLHIGGDISRRLLALGAVLTLLPRTKTVLTFHSGGYPSSAAGKAAAPRSLPGWIFRRFDRIIGVNAEIVELFRRWGVPAERLRLIPPHAVDSRGLAPELPPRLKAFFDSHHPVLLTVGLLEPEYDLPRQIDVLEGVRANHPGAGLAIIGAGSLEADLHSYIARKPYRENVLLCGDVEHASTLRAIALCDVFLRTTLYDGDSVSVREALHLGAPVLATDNHMRPEGVRLIPTANDAALLEAIQRELRRERPARNGGNGLENIDAVIALYGELTAW